MLHTSHFKLQYYMTNFLSNYIIVVNHDEVLINRKKKMSTRTPNFLKSEY